MRIETSFTLLRQERNPAQGELRSVRWLVVHPKARAGACSPIEANHLNTRPVGCWVQVSMSGAVAERKIPQLLRRLLHFED